MDPSLPCPPPGPPPGRRGPAACLLAAALLCLAWAAPGCRGRSRAHDAGAPPPSLEPEQRFGNDPELVADFRNLRRCKYLEEEVRLDLACPQVKELRLRLQTKRRSAELRKRLVTTLANLLESRDRPTRLMVAQSLYPHLQEPVVRKALRGALAREEIPAIRAQLLGQACRDPLGWAGPVALELLNPAGDESLRAAAAACLGICARAGDRERAALQQVLAEDPSSLVKGAACEALGRLGGAGAVAAMAGQLADRAIAWRCAAALSRLGTAEAGKALLQGAGEALRRGEVPLQMVAALLSFHGPGPRPVGVNALLQGIAGDLRLDQDVREAARAALGQRDQKKQ